MQLISTPAHHFSEWGLLNRDSTLWTSWSIVGPKHRVFFSGDTGQTNAFRKIGGKYGPFDVALFEIGQWHPAWGNIHHGPVGALDAFAQLNAKRLFPVHWAFFEIGLNDWNEPPETISKETEIRGILLVTPMLGEPVEPTTGVVTGQWCRKLPPIAAACATTERVVSR